MNEKSNISIILDAKCPENYKEVPGVTNTATDCFFISNDRRTRYASRSACEAKSNGFLAKLNDEATYQAVITSSELSFGHVG